MEPTRRRLRKRVELDKQETDPATLQSEEHTKASSSKTSKRARVEEEESGDSNDESVEAEKSGEVREEMEEESGDDDSNGEPGWSGTNYLSMFFLK